MSLKFSAITLFPQMFSILSDEGVVSSALKKKIIELETINLRNFSNNKRKDVDDHPAGGGDGMVIRADITEQAILSIKQEDSFIIHVTPSGTVFDHKIARTLSEKKHIIFLCGRYAGFDCRVTEQYANAHLSLGDFVLSGGELPALSMIDSIARFIPGVLGNEVSALFDSFENGLLESPTYTKPHIFNGNKIPDILLSGNHEKIKSFHRVEQIKITAKYRPDLIIKSWESFTQSEKTIIENTLLEN